MTDILTHFVRRLMPIYTNIKFRGNTKEKMKRNIITQTVLPLLPVLPKLEVLAKVHGHRPRENNRMRGEAGEVW